VIAMVNAQVEEMFGYDLDELLGNPIELLVPETRHRSEGERRPRYSSGLPAREAAGVELRGCRKDGSGFLAEISLSPVATEDGMLSANARGRRIHGHGSYPPQRRSQPAHSDHRHDGERAAG
jgi:PAS domain S-box-containing protein